jgi:hypothetical protein
VIRDMLTIRPSDKIFTGNDTFVLPIVADPSGSWLKVCLSL